MRALSLGVRGSAACAGAVAALALGALLPSRTTRAEMTLASLELRVQGDVLSVVAWDLDRDGLEDLAVAHAGEAPSLAAAGEGPPRRPRWVSVFYQCAEGRTFAAEADERLDVPIDACALVVDDLHPAPGSEVGYLVPDGVVVHPHSAARRSAARLARVISEPTFFDFASDQTLAHYPLTPDLDANGFADVLLPRKDGWLVLRQDREGRFDARSALRLASKETFGAGFERRFLNRLLSYRSELPRVAAADLNADGRSDVVAWKGRSLMGFVQAEGGAFPEEADQVEHLRSALGGARDEDEEEEEEDDDDDEEGGGSAERGNDREVQTVRVALEDVDSDGDADVVATVTRGRISAFESLRTRQIILLRHDDGLHPRRPDQVIAVRGVSMDPVVMDIDGDGAKDLVVSSLRTDLWTNIRRVLLDTMTITYLVYRGREPGARTVFSTSPDYARDVTVSVDRMERGGTIPLAHFGGDFDGDGVRDLLLLEDDDRVRVERGTFEAGMFSGPSLAFDRDEGALVAVPTSNEIGIRDLDGDGRSDVILWYRGQENRGVVRVLVPR